MTLIERVMAKGFTVSVNQAGPLLEQLASQRKTVTINWYEDTKFIASIERNGPFPARGHGDSIFVATLAAIVEL